MVTAFLRLFLIVLTIIGVFCFFMREVATRLVRRGARGVRT
jgi:hypothetical protein